MTDEIDAQRAKIAKLEAQLAEACKQAIPWRDGTQKPGIIGPIVFVNRLGYPISANYSKGWIIGYGTWERVKPIAWCYQNEFADAWSRITEPTQ